MTAANLPPPQMSLTDVNRFWPRLGLWFLFFLYWWLAYRVERIDLAVPPNWLYNQLNDSQLPEIVTQFVYFIAGPFSPRVLRHFIPLWVGWRVARGLAVSVIRLLYDLPDEQVAGRTLERLQYRELPQVAPYTLKQANFTDERWTLPLLMVGGPGRVEIEADNAIVTELNGRFRRVLGPGKHSLARFERVHAILDLRLQERLQTGVKIVTRDGIELETELGITFRIKQGETAPTKTNPFPFDETAARQAAYTQTALAGGGANNWQAQALTTAVSKLRDYVAKQPLDDLFNLEQNTAVYDALRQEVITQANSALSSAGVQIESARLGKLTVTNAEVTDQRIRYWQSLRANSRLLNFADGEAEALVTIESARAEAEAIMIKTIVEAVQRAQQEGRLDATRKILALQLVELFERMAKDNEAVDPAVTDIHRQLRQINRRLALE